jgi:ribosomal-protein-alanine N-acetyltransferase
VKVAAIPESEENMSQSGKDRFILCDGFYLRGLREQDLSGRWFQWFNDPGTTRFQNKGYVPNTLHAQRTYFERVQSSKEDIVLAIVDEASDRHVGNVGLHAIDWIHRSAVLGIVIGEREFLGRGWGRQAWAAITRYAFETINLNKVCASVFEGNEPSMKCALASGYEVEGTQKKQIYKNGDYRDLVWLGITHDRWTRLNEGKA